MVDRVGGKKALVLGRGPILLTSDANNRARRPAACRLWESGGSFHSEMYACWRWRAAPSDSTSESRPASFFRILGRTPLRTRGVVLHRLKNAHLLLFNTPSNHREAVSPVFLCAGV